MDDSELAGLRGTSTPEMSYPLPGVITLEGGISTGKSTLFYWLKGQLKDVPGIAFVDEPVEEWLEKGFLGDMYSGDISKGEFQHMALMSLSGDLLKTLARGPYSVIITERSPWSNYHTFGKANLEGRSFDLYQHTWERVLAGLPSELQVRHLYLRTPVETIMQRVAERGREAEQGIPAEYHQKIHETHEAWFKLADMQGRYEVIETRVGIEETRRVALDQISTWLEQLSDGYYQRSISGSPVDVKTQYTTMLHNSGKVQRALKESGRSLSTETASQVS